MAKAYFSLLNNPKNSTRSNFSIIDTEFAEHSISRVVEVLIVRKEKL